MGAVEEDLEMEEINWMMRIPWYIVIGALVGAYWQKSNKDVPFGKRYILKEAYWKWYILRTYPSSKWVLSSGFCHLTAHRKHLRRGTPSQLQDFLRLRELGILLIQIPAPA